MRNQTPELFIFHIVSTLLSTTTAPPNNTLHGMKHVSVTEKNTCKWHYRRIIGEIEAPRVLLF